MKRFVAAWLSFALIVFTTAAARAAEPCPPEVAKASAALKSAQAALKKSPQTARSQDVQAPRAQAGARSQDVQAPRSQDVQAPRSQDVQAPRSQDIQAPRVNNAAALVRQAEAACKKGDMTTAATKAREALTLLGNK
jgi:serine/threonine protein kinase HipA of HipAB toxin-antitoxin module